MSRSTNVISDDLNGGTDIEDGPGTGERRKSSSFVDVDVTGNLDSGVVIEDDSVICSGAKESLPSAGVAGNPISGTITDNGSEAADGAKSPSSTVPGNLRSGALELALLVAGSTQIPLVFKTSSFFIRYIIPIPFY